MASNTFNRMKSSNSLFEISFWIESRNMLSGGNKDRELPERIISFFVSESCFAFAILFMFSFFYKSFLKVFLKFLIVIYYSIYGS